MKDERKRTDTLSDLPRVKKDEQLRTPTFGIESLNIFCYVDAKGL